MVTLGPWGCFICPVGWDDWDGIIGIVGMIGGEWIIGMISTVHSPPSGLVNPSLKAFHQCQATSSRSQLLHQAWVKGPLQGPYDDMGKGEAKDPF